MTKKIILLIAVSAMVFGVQMAPAAERLEIEGSTTVGPIADAFAEAFKQMQPDVDITVKKTGSGDGSAALIDGRCSIASMSRFMKPKEFKDAVDKGIMPVAHVIAMDGVCVVVHPSNPVSALTSGQIKDVYMGKITNWKELGGADMPIVAITRDTSSGTYETFHELVMKKEKMAGAVETVSSNVPAQNRVKTTPGAIAYVGLGFLDGVKALKVDGVAPTKRSIAAGTYPVARPLYLFTNGYPKLGSLVHQFCTFYLSEAGQEIIEEKGFVPLTNY
ncbi:MAG: phosphate ABC transporter substrate-binding protein [Sedimentisphaerales bacterium]|nr:phosphate ABC transporter substrate-binding protein [Sedimentisphaerales bacterium]